MVLMGNIMILMKRDGAEGVYDLLVILIYDSVYGVRSILISMKKKQACTCLKILERCVRICVVGCNTNHTTKNIFSLNYIQIRAILSCFELDCLWSPFSSIIWKTTPLTSCNSFRGFQTKENLLTDSYGWTIFKMILETDSRGICKDSFVVKAPLNSITKKEPNATWHFKRHANMSEALVILAFTRQIN